MRCLPPPSFFAILGDMRMKKEEALRIILKCAEQYENQLADRNLLILCMDKAKRVQCMETAFSRNNFLHLTGVKFQKSQVLSANEFYNKCINKRLSPRAFALADNGTTEMKLRILPQLFTKNLSANMAGDFGARTPVLFTEKLAGSVKGGIGFVLEQNTGYYVPNTVLNEDIRKYIMNPQRVIAVYRKEKTAKQYEEITYIAKKNIHWDEIQYPEQIENLKELALATAS